MQSLGGSHEKLFWSIRGVHILFSPRGLPRHIANPSLMYITYVPRVRIHLSFLQYLINSLDYQLSNFKTTIKRFCLYIRSFTQDHLIRIRKTKKKIKLRRQNSLKVSISFFQTHTHNSPKETHRHATREQKTRRFKPSLA